MSCFDDVKLYCGVFFVCFFLMSKFTLRLRTLFSQSDMNDEIGVRFMSVISVDQCTVSCFP